MVKFGKKFFFNVEFVKKHKRVTAVVVLTIIGLIATVFFITNYFKDPTIKGNQIITIKEKVNIPLFSELPPLTSYFKTLQNVKLNDITIEFPDNLKLQEDLSQCTSHDRQTIDKLREKNKKNIYNYQNFHCVTYQTTHAGSFNLKFTIGGETYNSTLNVIDQDPPVLEVHDLVIDENQKYYARDFVTSCFDNSNEKCNYEFANTVLVNYDNYQKPGSYPIKLVAVDPSKNKSKPQQVTLTIKKIVFYTVTFDSNGGTKIESQKVKEGQTVSYPSIPYKNNFIFKGWYFNNREFDMATPITSNLTITAKWEQNKPTPPPGEDPRPIPKPNPSCIRYADIDGLLTDISIYDYQITGGTRNDCLGTKNYTDKASELRDKYEDEARQKFRNDNFLESFCGVTLRSNYKAISYYDKYHVGYLITYNLSTNTCNLNYKDTYYLTCKSVNDCNLE